jgi:hypothetical protein
MERGETYLADRISLAANPRVLLLSPVKTRAANIPGIDFSALYRRLKRYDAV